MAVEIAIEVDFVAYLVLLPIHPTVRQVGFNLAPKVVVDVFRKGNPLILAQCGIGFRISLLVLHDDSILRAGDIPHFDQRPFDDHLGVTEELVRIDFGVLAFFEVRVDVHQPIYVRVGDENAFVAEIAFHGIEEFRAVYQLDLAPASLQLAVRQDPDVGGDAGVEEELVGQRDDALQPVVFDDPFSDVALAAAGIAGEHRGAVQDDSDAASAAFHLGEHVLQEQQRSVGTSGRARRESSARGAGFGFHGVFVGLPTDAERGIGYHVVEALALKPVVGEAGAELDRVGVFAGYQHIRFADGVGLRVEFLTQEPDIGVGIDLFAEVVLADGQHAAGAAAGVEDATDNPLSARLLAVLGKQQGDQQTHDIARGVVFSAGLVGHFRKPAQQFLEDLAHGVVVHLVGVQIDLGELVAKYEQAIVFVQPVDELIQVEVFDDVPDIFAEAVEVVREVEADVVGVGFQTREVVLRGVVEVGVRRVQNDPEVCESSGILSLNRLYVGNGFVFPVVVCQDAVQPAQNEEGEGDVAVFVGFEQASEDVVGYVPHEVCEFLVVCHKVLCYVGIYAIEPPRVCCGVLL